MKRKNKKYPITCLTIGDYLRKRRLDLGLYQEEAATMLHCETSSLTNWELNHSEPQIRYFPFIISFLEFFPWDIDTSTVQGQMLAYRYQNGLSHNQAAKVIGVDPGTIKRLEERGSKGMNKASLKKILAHVS